MDSLVADWIATSLSSNASSVIFEDSLTQLWTGTSHNGNNKLSATAGQFSL
jgi:hypothetical protein